MDILDFNKLFPSPAIVLEQIESAIEGQITTNAAYSGFLKIHDSFLYLFSDDIGNTIDSRDCNDPIILLYSEAAKRIHSSSLLAKKGYYVDAVSLLRSVFELNKGINAIQNGIISSFSYFGENRGDWFNKLSEKKKQEVIDGYRQKVDNLIDNFDNKNIPNYLKKSLRTFKGNFHASVHKSFANMVINAKGFAEGNGGNLFQPNVNIQWFELYLNSCSFCILMYLRNCLKGKLLLGTNNSKIIATADFIENAYLNMGGYHKDIVEYIKIKYS